MIDEWLVLLQLIVVGSVILGLLTYLLRGILCKPKIEVCNQAILVTGCDSGVGQELAKHLDSLGFFVFAACLDTSSEGAQKLRIAASPKLRLVNMDVTNEEHVQHAVQYVAENLPAGETGLYGLVNNAGVCVCGEFEWLTWAQIQRQIEVNLCGTLRVTSHCLPLLKNAEGRIINVSSIAGVYGYPGLSVYGATKHAMEGFSSALRQEMKKFGVTVTTVQMGDFSKATRLLDNHPKNMNEMWNEMSDNLRDEYAEYFLRYHDTVARSGISGEKVKPLADLSREAIPEFAKIMLAKVPADTYLIIPGWYAQLKMVLLSWLPTRLAHGFIGKTYRRSWETFVPGDESRSSTPSPLLRKGSVAGSYPSVGSSSPPASLKSFHSGTTMMTSSTSTRF